MTALLLMKQGTAMIRNKSSRIYSSRKISWQTFAADPGPWDRSWGHWGKGYGLLQVCFPRNHPPCPALGNEHKNPHWREWWVGCSWSDLEKPQIRLRDLIQTGLSVCVCVCVSELAVCLGRECFGFLPPFQILDFSTMPRDEQNN